MSKGNLVEFIDEHIKNRMQVITAIEQIKNHYLVRDNVKFYVDEDGNIRCELRNANFLTEEQNLQVRARVNKIWPMIVSLNHDYKVVWNFIMSLDNDEKLNYMKSVAIKTIQKFDEIHNGVVATLKGKDLLPKNFGGKLDIDRLSNAPSNHKTSLEILQQYINYEVEYINNYEISQMIE